MGRKRLHPAAFECEMCRRNFPNRQSKPLVRFCSQRCRDASPQFKAMRKANGKKAKGRKCTWGDRIAAARLGVPHPTKRSGKLPFETWSDRETPEYKEWRRAVFERDRYTCQHCGIHTGLGKAVTLHAHHIKSYRKYAELRHDLDNGMTLCQSCHRLQHVAVIGELSHATDGFSRPPQKKTANPKASKRQMSDRD